MNRAERRIAAKNMSSKATLKELEYEKRAVEKQKNMLEQAVIKLNGMTQEEVTQHAYDKGFKDASDKVGDMVVQRYYTATMMALHELYGFGQERCLRTLRKIEELLIMHLTDEELSKATQEKLRIEIDMSEGINRAQPM